MNDRRLNDLIRLHAILNQLEKAMGAAIRGRNACAEKLRKPHALGLSLPKTSSAAVRRLPE